MITLLDTRIQKIAIKLKLATETLVKKGHPWVFENSIIKQNKEGKSGNLAIIFDNRNNKFLAYGFYDPILSIRIKILQANKPININAEWFSKKVNEAYKKRIPLLKIDTDSYRLIYGENDNLPSLLTDVYDNVLVVKLYASFWFYRLKDILLELMKISKGETTVLHTLTLIKK